MATEFVAGETKQAESTGFDYCAFIFNPGSAYGMPPGGQVLEAGFGSAWWVVGPGVPVANSTEGAMGWSVGHDGTITVPAATPSGDYTVHHAMEDGCIPEAPFADKAPGATVKTFFITVVCMIAKINFVQAVE